MTGLCWLVNSPRRLFLALAFLGLGGCGGGGVGKGNAPAYLVIYQSGSGQPAVTVNAYECLRQALVARMFFTDGSSGDFTARVNWSSSEPGTASISNGDQPAPSGGFYRNGTLTAVSGGQAIVTADYDGITASVNVLVGTPQAVTVKRIINGDLVTPTNNSFRMGAGTTESLTVTGTIDGVEENLQAAGASWSFDVPVDSEATIDATSGVITGVAAGAPLTATVGFDSCSITASTSVTVKNIAAISLQAEFGTDELIVGNTERISVLADFGDGVGPEQDISSQTTLLSSDPTTFSLGATGVPNIGSALQVGGPVNINATFGAGGSQLAAVNLQLYTVMATLENITVTPDSATLSAGSIDTAQYRAFGSYDAGTRTQEVTRQVTWSVSDSTVASISNAAQTAGQATAASVTKGGTIDVTATDATATITPSISTELTVLSP